jgi:hypothetical protein
MDARGGRFTLIRLGAEAATEEARLIRERAFADVRRGRYIGSSGEDVLIAFSHRSELRRLLGSRVLVVVEAALEGACGTIHAARSIAAVVEVVRPLPRRQIRRWLPVILEAIDPVLAAGNLPDHLIWYERSIRAHSTFWETRRRRDGFIAAASEGDHAVPFQAGLFDLRAERARVDRLCDDEPLRNESRKRFLDAMAAPLRPRAARPALILIPWRQ